jgi:hypothetical protein
MKASTKVDSIVKNIMESTRMFTINQIKKGICDYLDFLYANASLTERKLKKRKKNK